MVKISEQIDGKYNQYEVIPDIVNYIVKKIQPLKIVLYGSCARKLITAHSDIDLCIITKEELTVKERVKLRALLLPELLDITNFEVDIFICSEKEWQNNHKNQGTFIGKIYKEGEILYGR